MKGAKLSRRGLREESCIKRCHKAYNRRIYPKLHRILPKTCMILSDGDVALAAVRATQLLA